MGLPSHSAAYPHLVGILSGPWVFRAIPRKSWTSLSHKSAFLFMSLGWTLFFSFSLFWFCLVRLSAYSWPYAQEPSLAGSRWNHMWLNPCWVHARQTLDPHDLSLAQFLLFKPSPRNSLCNTEVTEAGVPPFFPHRNNYRWWFGWTSQKAP